MLSCSISWSPAGAGGAAASVWAGAVGFRRGRGLLGPVPRTRLRQPSQRIRGTTAIILGIRGSNVLSQGSPLASTELKAPAKGLTP